MVLSSAPFQTSEPLIIGWKFNGIVSDHFAGLIDEVRIYNGALSASQVQELHNLAPPLAPSLLQLTNFTTANISRVSAPVISGDGSTVAFVVEEFNTTDEGRLFAARTDGTSLIPISPTNLRIDFTKAISFGGNKIAFVACDGCPTFLNGDVYVIDSDGTPPQRLSTGGRIRSRPAISGDGSTVVYSTFRNFAQSGDQVFIVRSDGTGERELTLPQCPSGCSPLLNADGSKLVYLSFNGSTFKINVMSTAEGAMPSVVADVGSLGQPFAFTWSSDGKSVVYTRNSGVSIIKTDGTGFKILEPEGQFGSAGSPSTSFDASRVSYHKTLPGFIVDVFTINADGTNRRNLTNTPVGIDSRGFQLASFFPSISQNGRVITFLSTADLDLGKNPAHETQVFVLRIAP